MNRVEPYSGRVKQIVLETESSDETAGVGKKIGIELGAGDVIMLMGDLGVGKTVFAGGVAVGLGVASSVSSPTYTLIAEYRDGRLPFYHVDLFRLQDVDPFQELGIEEYLRSDGVAAIEWPDPIRSRWPGDYLAVRLEHLGGDDRRLTIDGSGARSDGLILRVAPQLAEAGVDG